MNIQRQSVKRVVSRKWKKKNSDGGNGGGDDGSNGGGNSNWKVIEFTPQYANFVSTHAKRYQLDCFPQEDYMTVRNCISCDLSYL